jgi:hypothetical protein
MVAPLLVTSLFQHPGWLKPLLVTAYGCVAAGTALVAVTIAAGCSPWVVSAAVIVQAIINGFSMSTAVALVWEAMGRGVAANRRGATLALAYGVGPILAATGSLGSQALLTGGTLGFQVGTPPSFPRNFALLFAAATVPMLVAAVLASRFVLPAPAAAAPAGPRAGFFTGLAYLATFQIYGAGELSGVYSPNYILAASRPQDIRRNLACEKILAAAAAPFGLLFGRIADVVGRAFDPSAGFRASFLTCAALVGTGLLVALTLPRRPSRPSPPGT